MASLLAVLWSWKVALGVLGAAALVWLILAVFVASRWPALHPTLARFRSSPWRFVAVGLVAAVALGVAFVSRPAHARARARTACAEAASHRRRGDRLVIWARPEPRVVVHSFGLPLAPAELTMLQMASPDHEEAVAEAEEARQEALAEAAEAAREAAEEARAEAEERARELAEEARERAEEMRERRLEARERAREARERAREISRRELERAQQLLERMGDEVEGAGDAVEEGMGAKVGALLERQAERVERLGHSVAEQLRELAERFDDGDDRDALEGGESFDL